VKPNKKVPYERQILTTGFEPGEKEDVMPNKKVP